MDADNENEEEPQTPTAPRKEGVRIIGADEAAAALEAGQAAGRVPEDSPRFGDVPQAPAASSRAPAARFPLPEAVDPSQVTLPPLAGSGAEMQHWTDPPTGEVPAVLASSAAPTTSERDEDDMAAWSGFAGGARWRNQSRDWDDAGFDDEVQAGQGVAAGDRDDPFSSEYDEDEETFDDPPPPRPKGRWSRRTARPRVPTGRPAAAPPGPGSPSAPAADDRLLPDDDAGWETEADVELPAGIGASASSRVGATGEVRISSRATTPATTATTRAPSSVSVRVATGIGVGLLLLVVAQVGPVPLLALCSLAVLLASAEGFSTLRRAGYHPATLLGLTGSVSLMVGGYLKGETALPLVAVLTTVFALVWYLAGVVRARPVVNIGATLAMFMWVGFLASFAGLLLDPTQFPHRHGVAFLMGAVIAAVGYDVGGFAFGRRLGRRSLAPNISPNKTWEGLVGGMLTSLVVTSIVVGQVSPWTFKDAIALGVVGAIVAPIGDLCQSMVKRDLQVKDMGGVLPGHGGMLDRIDAILFVLPATYYLVRVLGIG